MKNEPTVHLIGNAHLDPIWFWRLQDGLSEIKATFRSALDRIAQFPGFVFTAACISYYQWIEENCPSMFREIQQAVAGGRWCITGAMWVQPDCNIPSAESFARHFLYSQKYVREKFGITIKTGYNVDSFGHNGALPKLLREGGVENYVFMRPSEGEEKQYPFQSPTFRWRCGDDEVAAFRIFIGGYGSNMRDDRDLISCDNIADGQPVDFMMFYGVGNHGGGPTITNVKQILAYQPKARHPFAFSDPDRFFNAIRASAYDALPVYEGDLQNHASGCYSANNPIKMANCLAEDRLGEAEKWQVMANALLGRPFDRENMEDAWKGVLFNQFHDVLCGCSIEKAYDDAQTFMQAALARSLRIEQQALQAISWAVDTNKGVDALSKDSDWLWEMEDLGTPIVVFNPLSRPVKAPVLIRKPRYCAGITYVDETGEHPVPYQEVRGDMTEHDYKNVFLILGEIPAFGYRTFWVYAKRPFPFEPDTQLQVTAHSLENNCIKVTFDPQTGDINSLVDRRTGRECVGRYAAKALMVDDSANDTWAHGNFVFDQVEGAFEAPEFRILEEGPCRISLSVRQHLRSNTVEQVYTLYPDDETLHVSASVFITEPLKMVKLAFCPTFQIQNVTYGDAGDRLTKPADGREEPMQRFAAVTNGETGLAICPKGKYSACANETYMAFVAVRTCYFADHMAYRDGRLVPQDLGENRFDYTLSPFTGDYTPLEQTCEWLHAEFPMISETYHRGPLPQSGSLLTTSSDNLTVTAVKPAEDGDGLIFRIRETEGRAAAGALTWLGTSYPVLLKPKAMVTYRLGRSGWRRTNFLED